MCWDDCGRGSLAKVVIVVFLIIADEWDKCTAQYDRLFLLYRFSQLGFLPALLLPWMISTMATKIAILAQNLTEPQNGTEENQKNPRR